MSSVTRYPITSATPEPVTVWQDTGTSTNLDFRESVCSDYFPGGVKMVRKLHAEGFDEAVKLIEENSQNNLIVLFSGSLDAEGRSWCPDCVVAQPVIDSVMSTASDDVTFLHVSVGDKQTWKDANNRFRTDERFRVNRIPTLLKFGQPQRLEEEQCGDSELVKIMLEEL